MTRTELFELAAPVAKSLAAETDAINLDALIAAAAVKNNVAAADYGQFKSDVLTAKHFYFTMSLQKLPSENAAAQSPAKAKVATHPAKT